MASIGASCASWNANTSSSVTQRRNTQKKHQEQRSHSFTVVGETTVVGMCWSHFKDIIQRRHGITSQYMIYHADKFRRSSVRNCTSCNSSLSLHFFNVTRQRVTNSSSSQQLLHSEKDSSTTIPVQNFILVRDLWHSNTFGFVDGNKHMKVVPTSPLPFILTTDLLIVVSTLSIIHIITKAPPFN